MKPTRPSEQAAVQFVYGGQLSLPKVASLLGIPVERAAAEVPRGLQALARLLTESLPESQGPT